MKSLVSATGTLLFSLQKSAAYRLDAPVQFSHYSVIIVNGGQGVFHSDFGSFDFTAPAILFATPMQMICLRETETLDFTLLQFHSDFYCIAYHHAEIGCNGLLFNNIYISPRVTLTPGDTPAFTTILQQVEAELCGAQPSDIVLQSYLQVLLAHSSRIKTREITDPIVKIAADEQMEAFKALIEEHFLTLRKPADYAALLAMTPNNLTKRCTRYFKKTPSQLITERLLLEAKKQLHLTRKSIKEVAHALNFEDEFYFSRVFKKHLNESPQSFRDKTGISIMADLYR